MLVPGPQGRPENNPSDFIAGINEHEPITSHGGTEELVSKLSFAPSGAWLGASLCLDPSDESLGYQRASLRDEHLSGMKH